MFRIYIGSNNLTHQVEEDKIKQVVSKYFEGFTILKATGFWKNEEEDSRVLEIETQEKKKIYQLVKELKKELKQEAIGIVELPAMQFV